VAGRTRLALPLSRPHVEPRFRDLSPAFPRHAEIVECCTRVQFMVEYATKIKVYILITFDFYIIIWLC